MAYHLDKTDGSLVIDGFQNGIADDPYSGIADIKNANLISIPGEASVNFSTSTVTNANVSGTVISANAGADTVLLSTNSVQQLQAIVFTGGSLPAGIIANTVYWAFDTGGGNYNLYTDYGATSLLNITGTGTGTFTTINMGQPKYFNHFVTVFCNTYFMIDSNGRVWNSGLTSPGNWRYTGNSLTGTNGTAHGNGLVSYIPSDVGTTTIGYLFIFRDYQIDYATITSNTAITWTYGWNPATGATGQNGYLKSYNSGGASIANPIHESMILPDNKVYYCDANFIGRWYQADPNVGFVPTTTTTYVFDQTQILPFTDVAQCLAPLGNTLLIGGAQNIIYPWDTFSSLPSFPIFVAELNIVKMVTVNTNTYIFAGNRGRIYYTNGSQAQLYKKIPDHISGTVEPYFIWGGATSNKNQLYFSFYVSTNAGTPISQYGGLWAIDLDSKALRMTNTLSYQTTAYNGYATAIIPNVYGTFPAGIGLYIGWDIGFSSGTYGVDNTSGTPYTGSNTVSKCVIVSDLIPIGTFDKPIDFERIEYKLTRPMVSGESISVYARLIFDTTDSGFGTAILTDSTVGNFSNSAPVNFKNAQWLQLSCFYYSTASSPSFTRLKEFRIKRPTS